MRVEQQWIDPDGMTEVSHTPVSFSASTLWSVTDEDSIKLTFSRSERAPDIQELFSNDAHLATNSFDIGNPDLTMETFYNIELGFHIDHDLFQADFNLYQNWVADYISQINNGQFFNTVTETFANNCIDNDCLAVFKTQQQDAEFQGFEAQVKITLITTVYGYLSSELFADYVRGRLSNGGDIPRMPSLRYGLQLSWGNTDWTTQLRMTRAESQDNPGLNETETDGYWLLNLSANHRLSIAEYANILLFVKANNLLDQDIRQSVSFLRNSAPEAGRGAEMGLKIEF
jgi:iron complex outermembrane receptor protein